MSSDDGLRWCLFTSAGDRNAIRLWTEGEAERRWDLVIAYYGDSDAEFAALSRRATHAFRDKGSKFQNLRKLVLREPKYFDRYSHVWVCDDDIHMSPPQIDEAFAIAESFDFWVAQPAFRAEGKISYWFTYSAAPPWDFHIVDFIEENTPIFRRDKLLEFLAAYDGSHAAYGIDFWYMTVLKFATAGKFAIIDRVQVANPFDDAKGGIREILRMESDETYLAGFEALRTKGIIADIPQKILAYGKIASLAEKRAEITAGANVSPPELQAIIDWIEARQPDGWREAAARLRAFDDRLRWEMAIYLARGVAALRSQPLNRITRPAPPHVCLLQYLAATPLTPARFREIGAATAQTLQAELLPVYGIAYAQSGAIASVQISTLRKTRQTQESAAAAPSPPVGNRRQRRAAQRRREAARPKVETGDRS
ncbi:MAG TPA: hypothetical protein VMU87_10945 [Stellaceae bacterium]|nr:hypothetical protein [Stellaceae bacterium]